MKNIGIIFALDRELELFAGSLEDLEIKEIGNWKFYCGKLCHQEVVAVVCGMGKVNAALGTSTLIKEFSPKILINLGVSGGLDNKLEIGDFVVAEALVYHDVWCGEPNKYGQVQGLPESFYPQPDLVKKFADYPKGLFCCGDQFIADEKSLYAIKHRFPEAVAVDMESAAVAQTCFLFNTPFFCMRQISDTPGVEHNYEQYNQFWKNAPQKSMKVLQSILEKIV